MMRMRSSFWTQRPPFKQLPNDIWVSPPLPAGSYRSSVIRGDPYTEKNTPRTPCGVETWRGTIAATYNRQAAKYLSRNGEFLVTASGIEMAG
jgi:hypothetical protein